MPRPVASRAQWSLSDIGDNEAKVLVLYLCSDAQLSLAPA